MSNKFLISDAYYPDTLYLREKECECQWLFCEAKRGPRATTRGRRSSNVMNGVSLAARNSAVSSFLLHSNLLTVLALFLHVGFVFRYAKSKVSGSQL